MTNSPIPSQLQHLADQLRDKDGIVRQRARLELLAAGAEATPAFLVALQDETPQTRWEGAKGLSALGNPDTGQLLVQLLHDEDHGIRWLAADGLVKIGSPGLQPLLKELELKPNSDGLCEGAHHILHELLNRGYSNEKLQAVYEALDGGYVSRLGIPVAALEALRSLESAEA